ncbi:MAG: hypothetical protein V3R98_14525 [Alphaproteobacteria bacterium]
MEPPSRPAAGRAHPLDRRQRWTFCGTFLISFALLAFEILTVRTINFTVGPSYIYGAIAFAMLGLSAAGSFLTLVNPRSVPVARERILFWLCIGIAALLVGSHFMAADTKAELNAILEGAGRADGLDGVVRALLANGLPSAMEIGLVLCLPYFLFGALLAYLFATTEGRIYGRLYAADLVGAAFGSVGAIVLMELTGYALSVTAPAIVALAAAAAFAVPLSRRLAIGGGVAAGLLCMLPGMAWYAGAIEPPSDPNYLIRDYHHRMDAQEVWRGWNSFTRIGAVETHDTPDRPYAIMSLANGDGLATLWRYPPNKERPWRHLAAQPALLLDPPEDALVLLAGAGADLMTIYESAPGRTRVTGVELNPLVRDGALTLTDYGLAELLANDGIDLRIAEGRSYLERDDGLYDVVLVSFSGATAAYYAGSLGGTTQFLFTYEGLAAMLDRLKPGGYAVILQVNKVNTLAALRRYLDERGIDDPARTSVVLYRPGIIENAWDGTWDDNPLLIKPDGWTDEEVARLTANAQSEVWQVAYAPGWPVHPEYGVYSRILHAPDVEAELASLRSETGLRFDIVTDDRPFYLDLFVNALYLDSDFWFGLFRGKDLERHEIHQVFRVGFFLFIAAMALTLIIAPLFFSRGPAPTRRNLSHMAYFFCIGTGFMFLEIGIMQKASLLFGNPGLTIAIVLASIILLSGIGSLISDWSFRGLLSFRSAAVAVFAYALCLYLGLDTVLHGMLGWPLVAKALALTAIVAPGALLMGHLFPQGLALAGRDDAALVPWAWGINGAMSTISAGLAPLVAQAWGFRVVILIAAAIYAIILVLPPYRRGRTASGIAVESVAAAAE